MPETPDRPVESAQVQGGPVVLDIGGDIGALIVFLPESFAGTEIEIGLAGEKPFTHTGVHPRGEGENRRQTAIYPELSTGEYQLWHPGGGSPLGPSVHVEGGAVAELDLLDFVDSVSVVHNHGHHHSHPHAHSN